MYSVSKDIIMTRLDDEAALLNINTGKYFSLNSTGVRIWELLQKYGEIERICSIMQEEYKIDRNVLCHDVQSLVASMVNAGLVYMS